MHSEKKVSLSSLSSPSPISILGPWHLQQRKKSSNNIICPSLHPSKKQHPLQVSKSPREESPPLPNDSESKKIQIHLTPKSLPQGQLIVIGKSKHPAIQPPPRPIQKRKPLAPLPKKHLQWMYICIYTRGFVTTNINIADDWCNTCHACKLTDWRQWKLFLMYPFSSFFSDANFPFRLVLNGNHSCYYTWTMIEGD